jgi:hypothetical protein
MAPLSVADHHLAYSGLTCARCADWKNALVIPSESSWSSGARNCTWYGRYSCSHFSGVSGLAMHWCGQTPERDVPQRLACRFRWSEDDATQATRRRDLLRLGVTIVGGTRACKPRYSWRCALRSHPDSDVSAALSSRKLGVLYIEVFRSDRVRG